MCHWPLLWASQLYYSKHLDQPQMVNQTLWQLYIFFFQWGAVASSPPNENLYEHRALEVHHEKQIALKSGATAFNCAERWWQLQNIQSICIWLRENAKWSIQAEQIWKPCELICNTLLPYMQFSAEDCHMWLCTPFATDTCLTSCLLNQFNQHIHLITLLLIPLRSVDKAWQQALQGAWRKE